MTDARTDDWRSFYFMARAIVSRVLPFLLLSCSAPDSVRNLEDTEGAAVDNSTDAPVKTVGQIDLTDSMPEPPCFSGAAPSGQSCSCVYSDCEGCAVECICAGSCFDERDDCMIISQSGNIDVMNDALADWNFECVYQAESGAREFREPARMVCQGTPDRCEPPPDAPPIARPPITESCPVPVPGDFTLAEPVWGEFDIAFAVPFPEYAFAVAHASYALTLSDYPLRLAPSFFLATALKESFMGCSNRLTHWAPGVEGIVYRGAQAVDVDGCYQIESTTAWTELCRMYPNDLNCTGGHPLLISSRDQDALGRDNFVSSTHTAMFYYVWSFAFSQMKENITGLFEWFDTAADPYATEKLAAAVYNRGAWGGIATRVLSGCHDTLIEQCEPGAHDYVRQVGAYTREMEAQVAADNCYNQTIAAEDVDRYIDQLLPLYASADEAAIRAAGAAAFAEWSGGAASAPFQQVAGGIIVALEGAISTQVHCPEAGLNEFYVLWGETWACP